MEMLTKELPKRVKKDGEQVTKKLTHENPSLIAGYVKSFVK